MIIFLFLLEAHTKIPLNSFKLLKIDSDDEYVTSKEARPCMSNQTYTVKQAEPTGEPTT